MISSLFEGISSIGLLGRFMTIIIFSIFFPLTAISFFRYMVPKKEEEYQASLRSMKMKTDKEVKDIVSTVHFFLPVSFAFSICLFAIFSIAFADVLLLDTKDNVILCGAYFGKGDKSLIAQSIAVLSFAFIGAFIWSATNVIRRLIANDLSPSVYYSAGIRILMASVVALVLSFLLGAKSGNELLGAESSLMAIAFLTGMFPERILQYLIQLFQKLVNPDKLNNNKLSLYRIQGISMQHKERLEEIGIDNAQNLASTSLPRMMIKTPFKSRQLLDWIGQAKLLCYAPDHIEGLRSVGIRTVFDLMGKEKQIDSISEEIQLTGSLLQNIYQQITTDEGIRYLHKCMNEGNAPTYGQKK